MAVLIPLAACSGHAKTAYTAVASPTPLPGNAKVSVMGPKVPSGLQADIDAQAKVDSSGLVGVGPVVSVTPGGKLPAPVTLSFPLPAGHSDGVVVATAESAGGPWTLVQPTAAPDGRTISISTDHLSFWSLVKLDITDAVNNFNRDFVNGLTSDFTTEAAKPSCQNESAARSHGFTITSSAKDTLFWCFGVENGQRVLKVVNHRRYPLLMEHPGLTVQSAGHIKPDLDQLARLGSGQATVLYPFDQAVLTLTNRSAGGSVSTEFSGWAQSLYQLETGLTTAASILTRFGAGAGIVENGAITKTGFSQVATWMDKLLTVKDCFGAVQDVNLGEALAKCLGPSELIDIFGWKGVLLAPVVVAGSLLSYFRSEFNAIGDQINNRDKYEIVIRAPAAATNPSCLTAAEAAAALSKSLPYYHSIVAIDCDGSYAVVRFLMDDGAVDTNGQPIYDEAPAVFHYTNGSWRYSDRRAACTQMPKNTRLYAEGCLSS